MSERIQNVHSKEYKGIKYRSTLEANTAEVLDRMGIPFEYETQKITLLESFRCPYQKDKVRASTYTPDFILGDIIIECKGFETPEWKTKKKYIYKYLLENRPETFFYQVKDCKKQLLQCLDNHWEYLGYKIEATSKPTKRNPAKTMQYNSVSQAMDSLNLKGKSLGPIVGSLTSQKEYVYGYKWKLIKKI